MLSPLRLAHSTNIHPMRQLVPTRYILLFLTLFLAVALPTKAHRRIIQLPSLGHGNGKQVNATPILRHFLEGPEPDLQKGSDTLELRFPRGQYHFMREGAIEREYFISNHDHVSSRPIGLYLRGWHHVIIDGQGSELLFEDRMLPIVLDSCQDIELRHLTIDFTQPQITQLHILRSDTASGIVFTPAPWVQWRLTDKGQLENYGANWQSIPEHGLAFDPKTHELRYRTADLYFPNKNLRHLTPSEARHMGIKGSTQHLLYAPHWKEAQLPTGTVFAARTGYRPQPAIFITESRDIRLDHLRIHFAEGMGLLAQNSHDLTLEHFDVRLRPRSGRYFTTQADATHFVACTGKISVQHCHFENMMDDALNVHGVYLKVTAREGKHTLVGRFMHEQAFGYTWAAVGDSVRLVTSRDIQGLDGTFHVRSILPAEGASLTGARAVRITFEEELPADYIPERQMSMENLTRTPSVTFAHNLVRHNRARGILINTPRPVLIEGNTFDHVSGSAILFSTDNNMWYESGQTRQVTIRHNLFQDVLTSLYQFTSAVISIHPIIPELGTQQHPFYGQGPASIRIEDNVFRTFDTPLLHAISTDGILWRGNKIEPTKSYPKFHPNQKRFLFEGCRHIDLPPSEVLE